MRNISNIELIASLLEEHKRLVEIASDVVGHSITDAMWNKVHSMLSPITKYTLTDPLLVTQLIIPKMWFEITKTQIFSGSKSIRLYLEYFFPEFDAAAISFFLACKGSVLKEAQSFDNANVSHLISIDPNNSCKVIGVISIRKAAPKNNFTQENSGAADNIYERVWDILHTDN